MLSPQKVATQLFPKLTFYKFYAKLITISLRFFRECCKSELWKKIRSAINCSIAGLDVLIQKERNALKRHNLPHIKYYLSNLALPEISLKIWSFCDVGDKAGQPLHAGLPSFRYAKILLWIHIMQFCLIQMSHFSTWMNQN